MATRRSKYVRSNETIFERRWWYKRDNVDKVFFEAIFRQKLRPNIWLKWALIRRVPLVGHILEPQSISPFQYSSYCSLEFSLWHSFLSLFVFLSYGWLIIYLCGIFKLCFVEYSLHPVHVLGLNIYSECHFNFMVLCFIIVVWFLWCVIVLL